MTHDVMYHCLGTSTSLRRNSTLEPDDEAEQLEEQEPPGDDAADYVEDFKVFMTNIKGGTFSALSVSFENSSQILQLSAPSCSITPLLI